MVCDDGEMRRQQTSLFSFFPLCEVILTLPRYEIVEAVICEPQWALSFRANVRGYTSASVPPSSRYGYGLGAFHKCGIVLWAGAKMYWSYKNRICDVVNHLFSYRRHPLNAEQPDGNSETYFPAHNNNLPLCRFCAFLHLPFSLAPLPPRCCYTSPFRTFHLLFLFTHYLVSLSLAIYSWSLWSFNLFRTVLTSRHVAVAVLVRVSE